MAHFLRPGFVNSIDEGTLQEHRNAMCGARCAHGSNAGEAIMLAVDLKATDQKVQQIIAEKCAKFGRVSSVKVHRTPSAFALVQMATRDQAFELAATYGGSVFGNCALIHLEHKTA
jgi:hypothetical protein